MLESQFKYKYSFEFQYIDTIGSAAKWAVLSPNHPPPPDYKYRLPADLKHIVSYTTMKVLEGGNIIPSMSTRNFIETQRKNEADAGSVGDLSETSEMSVYKEILYRPVIKKDKLRGPVLCSDRPILDISLPHVSLHEHKGKCNKMNGMTSLWKFPHTVRS